MRIGPRPRELQGLGHGQPRQRAAADGVGDGDLHVYGLGQARGGGVGGVGAVGGLGGWGSNQQFPQLEFTMEFRQFPLWGSDGAGTCMDNKTSHLKSQNHHLPSFSQKVSDPMWPPVTPRWPPGESMNFRSGCWSSRSTRAPRPPRRAARRPNAWWTRWSRCPTKTLPACNGGTLRNPKEIWVVVKKSMHMAHMG